MGTQNLLIWAVLSLAKVQDAVVRLMFQEP